MEVVGWLPDTLPFIVSTGAEVVRAALAILLTSAKLDRIPPDAGGGPLAVRSRLLSALLLCLWRVMPEYAFVSRLLAFWRGFSCSVCVCLAWVLCVACVAFVRVRCLAD